MLFRREARAPYTRTPSQGGVALNAREERQTVKGMEAGATNVTVTIRNRAEPDRIWEGLFLVDTGRPIAWCLGNNWSP